ncbi:hypothetical protein BD324DRAFT_618350 [Kockovaella imperatae]|uniref:Uncharacterized protein n=1 Tax=Kockovaella imperatae TaxID=4999 RepID=A0A1Y1ULY5_9TREE|nr:hypothetical protein BD324DRAFT_618350 [Kockovaella imperatae]ORX39053.1 hypothetical protein BD324DRAFT_618350 [Kockovaella imperatae]
MSTQPIVSPTGITQSGSHTTSTTSHNAPGLDRDHPSLPPVAGSEADSSAATAGVQGVAPPSQVADTVYPNVPETSEPQQGATGPGQGSVVNHEHHGDKPSFKDQVNGFAKKIAGKVFHNEEEVQQGRELHGEPPSGQESVKPHTGLAANTQV